MNLSTTLVDLGYDDLLEIVRQRAQVRDFKVVNAADHKARGVLSKKKEDWLAVVQGNRNAVIRAVRKAGGIELYAFQVLTAAVEEASVGALAKDDLTPAEHLALVGPIAKVCAPWLLDGSPAPIVDAEKAKEAVKTPAGTLTDLVPVKPAKAAPKVEEMDVTGLFDEVDPSDTPTATGPDTLGLDEEDEDLLNLLGDMAAEPEPEPAPAPAPAPKPSLFAAGLRKTA